MCIRDRGIPTGFSVLDKYMTGLNKSDLILIGARPAMGKTCLLYTSKHLRKNAGLAKSVGIPPQNILIADNGKEVELTEDKIRISGDVPAGMVPKERLPFLYLLWRQ